MRLVCPNCDAQYEVDDGAIPDAGRDVQCSNCGHGWFQVSPELEAEQEAEEALFGPVMAKTPTEAPASRPDIVSKAVDASEHPEAPPKPDLPSPAALATEAKPEPDAVGEAPPATPPQPPLRRGLDESLLAVLREEAERETAVRRNETPRNIETQTDLGLEEAGAATGGARAAKDRVSKLRGDLPEPEETPEKPAARRDLLPDIEEINSTLRASNENRSVGDESFVAEPDPVAKAAFRSGFSLMMLVVVLLCAAYLAAPKIMEQLPASKGAMTAYVASVDKARGWLDTAMQSATSGLQNLTGSDKQTSP